MDLRLQIQILYLVKKLRFTIYSNLLTLKVMDHHVSDHCPLRISFQSRGQTTGCIRKMMFFEAFWAKEEEAESIVKNHWDRGCGGDMDVCDRLNICLSTLHS